MNYKADGISIGLNKRGNQDAWSMRLAGVGQIVVAVADGVGGHVGGATAAKIAVNRAIECLSLDHYHDFEKLFRQICAEILEYGTHSLDESDMATTLSVISISKGEARFGHVGDSRIYHLRAKGLIQLTEDQTEAALLVKNGILSPTRARTYKRRSILTSALSARGSYVVNSGCFQVMAQDRLMLLTDGAYRGLPKKTLRDISVASLDLYFLSKNLHNALAEIELHDDATIVSIEVS